MKKAILLTMFFVLGISTANAQGIRFGLKGGANFSTLDGDDVDADNLTSFYGGALVEINVFQNFSVQPEVLYSSQGAKVEGLGDIKLDYINVPVLAKFYLISDKLSLEAGPQFGFLVNQDLEETFEAKSFDFAAVGGLGFNITDNFFVQARYVIGLTDASENAEVKNTTIQAGVGFRF